MRSFVATFVNLLGHDTAIYHILPGPFLSWSLPQDEKQNFQV
jgi:hypothetical protein